MPSFESRGQQFGVRFEKRGEDDPHVIVQILVEDDGNWFEVGSGFSSFWLDDVISQLQIAKATLELESEFKKDGEWGYKFKE